MGILSGPAPNPGRVRRNKDTMSPFKTLFDDGILRGPDLESISPEFNWHPKTIQWWHRWRSSPQAQLMTDTDWDVMEVAARIYNEIVTLQASPGAKTTDIAQLSRELDRKTANYGATYADRLKLRFVIADVDPALPGVDEDEDEENLYGDLL